LPTLKNNFKLLVRPITFDRRIFRRC